VENGKVVKIKKFVSFSKRLKIPSKFLTPSLDLAVKNGVVCCPEYEIKAVVEHHGECVNAGHYTCVVKGIRGWVSVDDRIVRPVSEDFVRNRNAYILLYQQVNREFL
jgi:ubiquitin C-terminal hydrolase